MLKSLDKKGRWRDVTVGFRMSREESDDLNIRVKLTGMTKQDYIINRLLERDIIVQPNTRIFKALRDEMREILSELKRIEKCGDVTDEFLDTIKIVAQTYNGLQEK